MKFPKRLCEHLNLAKELVQKGEISRFPIAYSDKIGFSEKINSNDSGDRILVTNGDRIVTGFDNQKSLYRNDLYVHYNNGIDPDFLIGVQLFLPLVFMPLIHKERPFIMAHMAQTLDGKICTNSGRSKWIGNEENLKHAHRLRAMVDGVLVGGNTIANDLPKLSVRHVHGNNPTRLLLSNRFNDFDKLPDVPGMKTYVLRRKGNVVNKSYRTISEVIYYDGETEADRIRDLLSKLKEAGIGSILLEGGSKTVTSFYKENNIDWLQLHIAPIIFGSGKSFIQLSEINDVSEGRKLSNVFYNKMGDSIMVTGELS
ncbi:MAG: RibD family protein [Bacteroidota bacterium]